MTVKCKSCTVKIFLKRQTKSVKAPDMAGHAKIFARVFFEAFKIKHCQVLDSLR